MLFILKWIFPVNKSVQMGKKYKIYICCSIMYQLFEWKQQLLGPTPCTSTTDIWLCVKTDAFMWFNEKAIATAPSISCWCFPRCLSQCGLCHNLGLHVGFKHCWSERVYYFLVIKKYSSYIDFFCLIYIAKDLLSMAAGKNIECSKTFIILKKEEAQQIWHKN